MNEDLQEIIAAIVGFVGVSILIISGICVLVNWGQSTECKNIAKYSTGVTSEYRGFVAGCFVTEDGKTFPIDRWRVQDNA
jgi:hypothetical protein